MLQAYKVKNANDLISKPLLLHKAMKKCIVSETFLIQPLEVVESFYLKQLKKLQSGLHLHTTQI